MTQLADKKKKKSDPPALYKHEGVAICLVMHLICCQQLCTWQLMLISLYFHYLCIFTSAELWEGVNVVAAVLIDEGVNLGEGGKENWPFLLLQIPPEGISLYPPPERFIQPEKNQISHPGEIIFFRSIFVCWDGQPLIRERCYASLTASSPHHIPAEIFKFSQNTYFGFCRGLKSL